MVVFAGGGYAHLRPLLSPENRSDGVVGNPREPLALPV
jgi:hypothetical protein